MLRDDLEEVNCPTCGRSEQKFLLSKDGYTITKCTKCTLAMVNPRKKNTVELYQDVSYYQNEKYYYDYIGNKHAYQKGFREKLKIIEKYCPQKGNLLDIGAAHGFFMEEAQKFGFKAFGVELSEEAAAHASIYGKVYNQPLEDAEIHERFSVITFIDSLEHFEQPVAGLHKAWELLEPGGIVAIMVPNIHSLYARIARSKWHLLLPEEHLFYFTPQSLSTMLYACNFKLEHLGTAGYGRSISEILHVVFRGWRLELGHLDTVLKRISFVINLGDLFAIGRKIEAP